jgi:hypothetical protein
MELRGLLAALAGLVSKAEAVAAGMALPLLVLAALVKMVALVALAVRLEPGRRALSPVAVVVLAAAEQAGWVVLVA